MDKKKIEKEELSKLKKLCEDDKFEKLLFKLALGIDEKFIIEAEEYRKKSEERNTKSK